MILRLARAAVAALFALAWALAPAGVRAATLDFTGVLESFLDEPGFFAGTGVTTGAAVTASLSFDPTAQPLILPGAFGTEIYEFTGTFSLTLAGVSWLSDIPVAIRGGRVYGFFFPGSPTPLEPTSFEAIATIGTLATGEAVTARVYFSTDIPVTSPVSIPTTPGAIDYAALQLSATVFDPNYCGGGFVCNYQRPVISASSAVSGVPEPRTALLLALAAMALRFRPSRQSRDGREPARKQLEHRARNGFQSGGAPL